MSLHPSFVSLLPSGSPEYWAAYQNWSVEVRKAEAAQARADMLAKAEAEEADLQRELDELNTEEAGGNVPDSTQPNNIAPPAPKLTPPAPASVASDTRSQRVVYIQDHKLKMPSPFTGKAEDVKMFVTMLDLQFQAQPRQYATPEARTFLVISLLKDSAFTWIEPYVDSGVEKPAWFFDWPLFKKKLLEDFGYHNQVPIARRKLAKLVQKGTVPEYAIQFRALQAFINNTDEASRYSFFSGLKVNVQERLLNPSNFDSLNELISIATKNDALLHAREGNIGSSRTGKPTTYAYTPPATTLSSTTTTGTRTVAAQPTADPSTPMDVDATLRVSRPRGPLTDAEKKRRRDLNLCSYCGGSGHYANACPARPGHSQLAALAYAPNKAPQGDLVDLRD